MTNITIYRIIQQADGGWAVVETSTGVSVGPFKTKRAAVTYLKKRGTQYNG
jgi:hypothetical protein